MDIVRPEIKRKKKIRLIIYIAAAVVLIPLVTYALSRLKPRSQRRPRHDLDGHCEARADAPRGARSRYSRPGDDTFDSCRD